MSNCANVAFWAEIDFASLDASIAFGVGTCSELSPSRVHRIVPAVRFPFVPEGGIYVGVHLQ